LHGILTDQNFILDSGDVEKEKEECRIERVREIFREGEERNT